MRLLVERFRAEEEKLAEMGLQTVPAYLVQAGGEARKGQKAEALATLSKVLDWDAKQPVAWWLKGQLDLSQGRFDAATEALETVKDLDPDDLGARTAKLAAIAEKYQAESERFGGLLPIEQQRQLAAELAQLEPINSLQPDFDVFDHVRSDPNVIAYYDFEAVEAATVTVANAAHLPKVDDFDGSRYDSQLSNPDWVDDRKRGNRVLRYDRKETELSFPGSGELFDEFSLELWVQFQRTNRHRQEQLSDHDRPGSVQQV